MISPRYSVAVCALLLLALVPTIIHSYAGVVLDDGRRTASMPTTLAGLPSRPSSRNATWGQRRFESFDWVEQVHGVGRDEVTLTILRSYDLKSLYHHPELAVAYGKGFLQHRIERFPAQEDVPVHILETGNEAGPLALYALHYGDGFVEEPITFQLRTALELLFRGRRPMTLFFAQQGDVPAGTDIGSTPSARLMREAIQQFVASSSKPTAH